jgi:hypothetical protein
MEHLDRLNELGVEFRCGTGSEANLVTAIKVPWTAEEWLAVIDKEGEDLPMCCGNISAGRDILISSLREGGWLETDDFSRLDEWVFKHDGLGEEAPDDERPMNRLYRVWKVIKDNCKLEWQIAEPLSPDLSDPLDALHMVLETGEQLSFDLMFSDSGESHRSKVSRTVMLAALLPALRALNEHIAELDLGPIEGFGVYGATGQLEATNVGLAIVESLDDIRHLFAIWERHDPGCTAGFTVRRVRVTSDGGVENLETVTLE